MTLLMVLLLAGGYIAAAGAGYAAGRLFWLKRLRDQTEKTLKAWQEVEAEWDRAKESWQEAKEANKRAGVLIQEAISDRRKAMEELTAATQKYAEAAVTFDRASEALAEAQEAPHA